MDKSLLKLIVLIAVFIGVICGILTSVPFVGNTVFVGLLCLASIVEMTFLIKVGLLEIYNVQESMTVGAIVGFVSFVAFCVVYFPVVIVLAKFFNYSANYGVSLMLQTANFGVLFVLSVFMALLSATINAFTGFVTFYVNEFLKSLDKNSKKNDNKFK